MKTIKILPIALFTIFCFFSCQKLTDETSSKATQTLTIKARSISNEQVKYPLYIYAFDQDGTCCASQTIQSSNDTIGLAIGTGEYRIVAISDISGGYQLPEHPNAFDEISIPTSSGATTPMMMGKADISIGNKTTALNITLSYAVTAVSAVLKGVPSDVSAVQVTISPLYGSICMNGEYTESNAKLVIPCKLNTEGYWIANPTYAFPGSGNETVFSILLTKKDGSQDTYAYTYKGTPEANRPFNIGGNYLGYVTVGGEFIVKDWEAPIEVSFNFGKNVSSTDNNNQFDNAENNGGSFLGELPHIGEIFNQCVVVDIIEQDEYNATLLLMDTEEWICYAKDAYSVPMEAGNQWRLPNEDEAKLLNETFRDRTLDTLNELLSNNGYSPILIDKRYLYDKDGEIYAYGFKSSSKFQVAGNSTQYRVRLVKNQKFSYQ